MSIIHLGSPSKRSLSFDTTTLILTKRDPYLDVMETSFYKIPNKAEGLLVNIEPIKPYYPSYSNGGITFIPPASITEAVICFSFTESASFTFSVDLGEIPYDEAVSFVTQLLTAVHNSTIAAF